MMNKKRYRHDFEQLLAVCEERNVAVPTIKSIARGPWATHERDRTTWYQPLEDQEDIDRAVSYVLGIPCVFLNTVGDINLLPRVLDAASRFRSGPSDEEMEAMLEGQKKTSIFGI